LYLLDIFLTSPLTSMATKIHPVGAELFHASRQTDGGTDGQREIMKITVVFRCFANTYKYRVKQINFEA